MITIKEFEAAGLKLDDELAGNAALEYIKDKTTLTVDLDDPETVKALPSLAKMFILRFAEITTQSVGVASESIEGLSQSFRDNTDISGLLSLQANEFLGQWLKDGGVRFVTAHRRW